MFLFLFGTDKTEEAVENKPLNKMTDSELVESTIAGNAEAFTEIVKRYEKLVYSTAFFTVKNKDDAWDISQEVFMRVYNSIGSFRGESKFTTWLYRLCKNVTYDFVRKHYKNRELTISEISESGDSDEGREFELPDTSVDANPEQSLLRKENIKLVRKALLEMDEQQRTILVLREMQDKSYTEIAEILGIELGTVKSKLNRARAALKQLLIEKGCF